MRGLAEPTARNDAPGSISTPTPEPITPAPLLAPSTPFEVARMFPGAAYDIAADSRSNLYVTGVYYGAIDFGNGVVRSKSDADGFVVKLDPRANVVWAKTFGTIDGESMGMKLVVDPRTDHVTLFGGTHGRLDFGLGPLTNDFAPLYDMGSSFAVTFDADGTALVNAMLATMSVRTATLAPDGFLVGGLEDSVPVSSMVSHYARLDSSFRWSPTLATVDRGISTSVALTETGLFLAGSLGTVSVGGATVADADPSQSHSFLTSVGAGGEHLSTRTFDGRVMQITPDGDSLLVAGQCGNACNGSGVARGQAEVMKVGPRGTIDWIRGFGGKDRLNKTTAVEPSFGSAYAAGIFSTSITFGDRTIASNGSTDAFVVRLDAAGNVVWGHAFGGPDLDGGPHMVTSGAGVYAAGWFTKSLDLGSGPYTPPDDIGWYLVKLPR